MAAKKDKHSRASKRLRPGELDGLVLAYMRRDSDNGPLTASAIGKGIDRSPGAIANCLGRLAKEKKVRQAKKRPRAYVVREVK